MMQDKKEDYRNKWQRENQDRIIVMVRKGKKDAIRIRAAKHGESVNGYINRLIDQDMAQDSTTKEDA